MVTRKIRQIGLAFAMAGCLSFAYAAELSLGAEASNFTLKSNSGENLKLSEQRGQPVVLAFWASWCGGCRQQLLNLNTARQQPAFANAVVWGINLDENRVKAEAVGRELNLGYPILFDASKRISEQYHVDNVPTLVLVDENGKVRFIGAGGDSRQEELLQQALKALSQPRE